MFVLFTTFIISLILAANVLAASVKLTIYDDGLSCPAECDAHVVFHLSMNGTKFAHAPSSSSERFDRCAVNSECHICFDENSRECLTVMYRGGGPPPNTFDFTPAFYEKHCSQSPLPATLAAQCHSLKRQARTLDERVNCIRNPEQPQCLEIITTAKEKQAADRSTYEQCKREGESNFNRGRPRAQQRSLGCTYEKQGTGGPNSRGKTWKRLLPGACRDKTFVGRDGLDCCNGEPISDGPLGIECQGFYPKS